MRTVNFGAILAWLAFIALAAFSCYWTSESLYIWRPQLTLVGAWLIAIVFYVVASICFGVWIKTFDRHADYYGKFGGRGGAFLLGLFGLLIFWLAFSLPTNTHTLLYRAEVANTIQRDIQRADGYLQALKDNNTEIKRIEAEKDNKYLAAANAVNQMQAEINNYGAVGIGHRFEAIVSGIEQQLSVPGYNFRIQRQAKAGTSPREWQVVINNYTLQIKNQLDLLDKYYGDKIKEIRKMTSSKELNVMLRNDKIVMSNLAQSNGDPSDELVEQAVKQLDQDYAYIARNAQYLTFQPGDKERYTKEGAQNEVRDLQAVPTALQQYLTTDKYDGHGFWIWILLAALIDLAAFILFTIALKASRRQGI